MAALGLEKQMQEGSKFEANMGFLTRCCFKIEIHTGWGCILILGVYECDLIWKEGLGRCHQIKIRPGESPMTGVFTG